MNVFQLPLGASARLFSEATMERLGWVLLHSLWQFLLIAILALVVLRFIKRSSASLRYVTLVFTMAVCVVIPVATWFTQTPDSARAATEVRRDATTPLPLESMPPRRSSDEIANVSDDQGAIAELPAIGNQPSVESSVSGTELGDWWRNARERLRPWLMSIVTAWILGVMICATRPLLSWVAIRRWRRIGTTPVSQEVTELMLRLSDKLAVGRTVEILQSSLVHVPLVFGWVRPLILLPASLLANLPTSQLEAIIAHELAHVRRHDFLVNFMQTIIETLFFYHPAIWWLSHRIRIERENCCDDLAVSVLCNRIDYGRALLAVEENQGFASTLALGARGGSLLARVQRLAGLESARRRPVASVAAMITSGLLVAGTAFMIGSLLFASGDDNDSQFGKESNGLQIRLIPLSPDVSDESPELQKIASSFKRSQEMTFAVQLKNVSGQPISLAGIRYGDGYAPETRGKLNTAMLASHWFEFEFTDSEGKRLLRTPHREFYDGWHHADGASVHVLAPGESLIEVLRPSKFMQPMDYDLLPGKYRVQVHYRGPNASLRENVRKHWPNKPILNAWPHQATSNVSDFAIEEASNRAKPEELIWGKPVEGLQAALEYRLPDDAKGNPLVAPGVAVGSRLGITFHLRNVSDKPITFVSETGRQGDNVHVTDVSGKEVEVKDAFFTGEPIDVAWELMPGEVAQLGLLTPGLGSLDKPGKYKVRYTVRFNSRIQKDDAGNIIFPRPGDYDNEVDTGEAPLFLHDPKDDLSANGEIQLDGTILGGAFRDEVNLKLTRKDAHQGKWYFIDLDHGKLKTPPFDVEIDAKRFPYFVSKPSEEELSNWLKRDDVDLILRSSIYRPDPKGPIEKNDIQVRSVRTLLKDLPRGLEKETTNSPTWKQTLEEDVLDAFGAKDDAVHVVGFIPNATAFDIRPESPFLRSFRTASNLLGVFLLEQPSSNDDELNFRIAYAANKDTPLDDLRFGPDDFVSGLELLEKPVVRQSSEAPFIAKFPNDIRVEFVGLSRGVGDIKAADKWWRPDGSPLEQALEHRGASGVLKEGELESEDPFVRTVIHVHGIGDSNAVTATSSIQTAESLKDKSGGLYVAHHGYADAPGRSRTFEVGVATEAPSPKRWLDRDGKRIESKFEQVRDPIAEDITIEKVGPESWGKGASSKAGMKDPVGPGDQKMGSLSGTTQVTIRFPLAWRNVDLRLFAIDKSGNSHGDDMTITLEPNDENASYKRVATTFPVDYSDVDHFEYQFRVYRHWAIFENVSLWKGTQTEVVTKSETISATSRTAASAQPAKVTVASETANSAEARNVNKPHRVIDSQGNPVAGAKIDCLPSMKYSWQEAPKSLGSIVTDSDGWFDYPEGLPFKERFYVYVSSDDFLERFFQANNGEAYVLENGIRKPDTLALRRPVTISGKIIGIDGKPLADAEIAVDYMYENGVAQINGNRVKSDSEGRFVAKGVEPANVFVRYETPYNTNDERMPIGTQPGKLCIVAFTATDGQQKDDIVLDLSKCNCIVEGRIVDHEDKGVPNRWIQATIASAKGRLDESITVKSDAEGRFRFEGLTADEFVIGTYTPSSIGETVKPTSDKPAVVRLTTYVQGTTPPANEPNPPIYGEPSQSGIAGGIRVQGGAKHKLGEMITAEVLIKNTSNQVKMFAYSFAEQANLRASEGDKSIAELNYSHFTGLTVTTHYRLEPNQEAVVGSFNCGLHDPDDKQNGLPKATFQIPCRAGQVLTLRCDMSANLFGRSPDENAAIQKDAPLSTGTISMQVMPTDASAQVVRDTDQADVVANRGTLRGRFVFDGMPPTSKDYFSNKETIDGSEPQQPGPDGRKSGVEALYRVFLAEGIQPDTKPQTLLVGKDSGVANIYIWASSKNIPWEAEGLSPVNVEFRDGRLTNRCINVVPNQKLQLENHDPVDHSLAANFTKARNSSFNLLVKAKSKFERDWSFPVAEPFPTRLDLGRAPWASGVLFVHSNPYVAITQSDGSFEIANLPVGEWEFQVWHETAGYLLPNRAAFKHTIVVGENNVGTKLLKPEAFGIYEAAKAVPVKPENREQIGTVQGKPVYRDEIAGGNLLELFTQPIWTKYKEAHRESIVPTEKELETARSYFSQQHRVRLENEGGESKLRDQLKLIEEKLSSNELSEEAANELEIEHSGLRARLMPPDPSFAHFILDNWKLQKHLYENFGGGRILWQQAGQEAFDATRTWLELQEKNGEFQIADPKLRTQFYQYWNQDHGSFLTSDKERIANEFLQPPWATQ